MTAELSSSQPLPFRVLLDEAVRQARRHFGRIYPAIAVPLALVSAALPLAQLGLVRAMSVPGSARPSFAALAPSVGTFLVVVLLWLVVYLVGYGAMLSATVDAVSGRDVVMGRSWLRILRPKVLGTLGLTGLGVGAGLALCFFPGLYLGLLWSFVLPVMVEEGVFGTRALRRSAELARYNPHRQLDADPRLKVFLVSFVGALLGYVTNFVVQVPFAVVQQVLMFRDVAAGHPTDPTEMMARMTWLQVPAQILGMLTRTAVQLYVCFGLALVFFDVKGRREGLDLEAAVARLVASRFGAREPAGSSAPVTPEADPA